MSCSAAPTEYSHFAQSHIGIKRFGSLVSPLHPERARMTPTTPADFVVAIPARYASTRLPGKPLQRIGDRPMIQHVAERALLAG
ncbi:cytidylyltransferase domain-containing protein, partial [Xanthomonas perforans]|uniref:cytidylyltransferase domain-containing protein n=1 Tax=Xanthomonas TaxID=338 RepID=UPI003CCF2E29